MFTLFRVAFNLRRFVLQRCARRARLLKPRILDEQGFSLVEVVITVGVMGIVGLGTTVLFTDMVASQRRTYATAMLTDMRVNLIAAAGNSQVVNSNQTAWALTVADASAATGNPPFPLIPDPGMDCLRRNTACTRDTRFPLNLKYRGGVAGIEAFYSRNPTRGFDFEGRLCNTYSAAPGNPRCPFRWDLFWIARCVGTSKTACENATIEIVGELKYSPGANNPLGAPLNPDQYNFNVRRGDRSTLNMPVVIQHSQAGSAADGGSSCFGVGYSARRVGRVVMDPGNNATVIAPVRTLFTLRSGTYNCRIKVPGYKNNLNGARLRSVAPAAPVLIFDGVPANAALFPGGFGVVTIDATFAIGATTTFTVEHQCSATPEMNWGNSSYILGVPAPSGPPGAGAYVSGTIYTTINCIKTS